MLMSAIEMLTSMTPRGGRGTSPQKFDIYFSNGTGAFDMLIRYICLRNKRNCHKNGYLETTQIPKEKKEINSVSRNSFMQCNK